MKSCRVCNGNLKTILIIPDQPKAAQYLGTDRILSRYAKVELEVAQCVNCGLIQLENKPVDYYKEVIRAGGGSASMKQRQAKSFTKFLEYGNLKGKKIVEIGEGKGEYLSILNTLGVDAKGLGYYPADCISDVKYDGFVCINFLEHAPDPNEFLRGAAQTIDFKGFGMISVPDFLDNICESSIYTFVADHLLYFTPETLEITLRLNGFAVLELFHNSELKVITAYVCKQCLPSIAITGVMKDSENIEKGVQKCFKKARKVALWGASHHAFSLLSNQEIGNKVSYIVDSAPHKQGKFAPVSGIEIFPPQHLSEDSVDMVLIMAPEYAKEIAEILKEKYEVKHIVAVTGGKIEWLK